MFTEFWQGLGRGARAGLMVGVTFILVLTAIATVWLFRTDYQVLFADLNPQDAAAMVAELDRMKVSYKLGDGGTSILVDREAVHKTRIKLMGKDLPLHGAVGLELFNNADFGMTEFAQKVNYQRALQGEITRTILSLSEIESVRVHLAMPEEGLFKRVNSKAKASITLILKQGKALRPEQITGIQRLVSASVPGMLTQDVTIVDQHGVALTRPAPGEVDSDTSAYRLDLKKETENYLGRKVSDILERTFGAGQAMASVDVTLNMDQVRVTTEDIVSPPGRGGTPTGVVVRERETMRDGSAPADPKLTGVALQRGGGSSSQREVEYQVGRRVEQVVSSPGSIRKVHVVAIIKKSLDPVQTEQIRNLLFAASGASLERGDTVVVQTLNMGTSSPAIGPSPAATTGGETLLQTAASDKPEMPLRADDTTQSSIVMTLALLLAIAAGIGIGRVLYRKLGAFGALTDAQREAGLAQVRRWMAQEASAPAAGPMERKP